MSQTQIEKDKLQPGEAPWMRKEITEAPVWQPSVGDSLVGELSIPGF